MSHPVIVWPEWKPQLGQWLIRNPADSPEAESPLGDASAHQSIVFYTPQFRTRFHQLTGGAFDENVTPEFGDASAHQHIVFYTPKFRNRVYLSDFDSFFTPVAEPDTFAPYKGFYRPNKLRRGVYQNATFPYVEFIITDDSGVALSENLTVAGPTDTPFRYKTPFGQHKLKRVKWSAAADDSGPTPVVIGDASAHTSIVFARTLFKQTRVTVGAFDLDAIIVPQPDTFSQYIGRFKAGLLKKTRLTSGAFDISVIPEPDTFLPFPGHFRPGRLRKARVTSGAFDLSVAPQPDTYEQFKTPFRPGKLRSLTHIYHAGAAFDDNGPQLSVDIVIFRDQKLLIAGFQNERIIIPTFFGEIIEF